MAYCVPKHKARGLSFGTASKLRDLKPAKAGRGVARSVRAGSTTLAMSTTAKKKKPRPTSSSSSSHPPPPPPPTLADSSLLFLVGATLGPPLDGIHGAFGLLRYGVAPMSIGDASGALRTSLLVPVLLGVFYAVSGALHLAGDGISSFNSFGGSGNKSGRRAAPAPSFSLASCALAAVVAHLSLSALLYSSSSPLFSAAQISLALYPLAFLVWLCLDRTKTGLALAAATAVAAPLAELLLMNAAGVWTYPRADFFLLSGKEGIVSWVPACYFAYSCWIGALARAVARARGGEEEEK